jgi:hypothetical protein
MLFDGLFGDTETSKALAAFIHIWYDLLKERYEEMGWNKNAFGRFLLMGHVAKSMTVKLKFLGLFS